MESCAHVLHSDADAVGAGNTPFVAHKGHACRLHAGDDYGVCAAIPQVFDLKRTMQLPLHNHKRLVEVLKGEEHADINRNAWKRKEWMVGEDYGWDMWELASLAYFRWAPCLAQSRRGFHACELHGWNASTWGHYGP